MTASPASQLADSIAKFPPSMAAQIKAARAKLRKIVPHAHELVYHYSHSLVLSYGPTDHPWHAVFTLACKETEISLYFLGGPRLPDPQKLLRGSGKQVRFIALPDPATFDQPAVRALIAAALKQAPVPFDSTLRPQVIIKTLPPGQRPRRAATPASAQSKIGNRKAKI
jgi:hypothetical protein